jgi:hypothetical protein
MIMARERVEPTKEKAGKPVAVELPSEVVDGPFRARVSVPDEDTIVVTIKREDKDLTFQVRFEVVRVGRGRFEPNVSVLKIGVGGNAVLVGFFEKNDVEALLKVLAGLLHTKQRNFLGIASLLVRAFDIVIKEAREREREYRRRLVEKFYKEALQEQGLREDTLRYVKEALDLMHAGDEPAKKVGVLAIVSTRLPEDYRFNVLFIAPSGRGKTNLIKLLRKITPKYWRLDEALSLGSSPLAIFYKALEHRGFVLDMARKVWFVNEPSWLILTGEEDPGRRLMKQAISDTTDREPVCYETVINTGQSREAVKLCLRGRAVVFATIQDKYSHMLDEQVVSRMLPVALDPSREVLGQIVTHIVYEKTREETRREFARRARLIRVYLSRLPVIDEVVFTDEAKERIIKCDDPTNVGLCGGYVGELVANAEAESVVTRATDALKALAACVALLRGRVEKRGDRKILTVRPEDVDEAWGIAKPVIEAMALGINPLYLRIKTELLDTLRQGPKKRGDIVSEIKARYNVSTRWIDNLLRSLVALGVIEKCGRGVYAITCPGSGGIKDYVIGGEREGEGEQAEGGGGES